MDKGNTKLSAPLLFITLVHLAWLLAALHLGNFYHGDSPDYLYLADNMLRGYYYAGNAALPLDVVKLTQRPPVYSFVLIVNKLFFGQKILPLVIFQNALSIFNILLIYNIFKRLFNAKNGIWYWLMVAAYPAQMYFADMVVCDMLFQTFAMLYCLAVLKNIQEKAVNRLGLMSLWLVLAFFTKPIVYPLLFIHTTFFLCCLWRRNRYLAGVMAVLVPLATMCGYGYWNKSRTGFYHISSVQSMNMLRWNAAGLMRYREGAKADSIMQLYYDTLATKKNLQENYLYANETGKYLIKSHLFDYGVYHTRESVRFFIDPDKLGLELFRTGIYGIIVQCTTPVNFVTELKSKGLLGAWHYIKSYTLLPLVLITIIFNIIRIAGFIMFLAQRRLGWQLRLFLFCFVAYFAFVTGPVANARYFLPVLLPMSAAAWVGLSAFFHGKKQQIVPKP
ncbi:MAG: glycosyltransferase family 39 protein [Edaphocola sp.]